MTLTKERRRSSRLTALNTRSLGDQKAEKNSARDTSERASAPIRFKRRLRRKRAKADITNEQALQHNITWTDGKEACSTCFVVKPLVRSEKCLIALDADSDRETWWMEQQ